MKSDGDKKLHLVKVIHNSHERETSRPNPNDEWDRSNTHTDWNVVGLTKGNDSWDDLAVEFEPVVGETYYLVYAIYSTGDSFGHDHCGRIEFIELYKSEDKAHKLATMLKELTGDYSTVHDKKPQVENETGTKYTYRPPWLGYFENLESLVVESFAFQPRKMRTEY